MQINGPSSGPTMAASEPPEPPPRNPDRINVSLNKLGESKVTKSLDCGSVGATTINDKFMNNNKQLRPILSLDNNLTRSIPTTTTIATASSISAPAISSNLSTFKTQIAPPASTTISPPTTSTIGQSPSAYFFNKRINIQHPGSTTTLATTTATVAVASAALTATSSSSSSSLTINSNGSGSNQTLTSPMTADNQKQQSQQQQPPYLQTYQQQQQQHQNKQQQLPHLQRYNSVSNRSDQNNYLMQQQYEAQPPKKSQQQQQHNGTQRISSEQLINGSGNANVTTPTTATTTIENHVNAKSSAAVTEVDQKNGNDVSPIIKLMGLEATGTTATPAIISVSGIPATAILSSTAISGMADESAEKSELTNKSNNSSTTNISSIKNLSNRFHDNRNNDATNKYNSLYDEDSPKKLRQENERLNAEVLRLRKLLENSPEGAVGGIELSDSTSCGDAQSTDGSGSFSQQRVDRLEAELRSAKNQLLTLRMERKKLRADKNELLAQVNQLCSSLEEKEHELREFIRNFHERIRETETNNAKMSGDRERERWELLKQARDEAERSLALAQQLNARDIQLQRLQDQLQEARRQLSGCLSDQESLLSFAPLTPPSGASGMLSQLGTGSGGGAGIGGVSGLRSDDSARGNSNSLSAFSSSLSGASGATGGDRGSCSADSGLRGSSDRESTGGDLNFSDGTCDNGPCITVDPDSISLVSSQNMYQFGTPKERSPTLSPINSGAYSRSVEQLGSPVDPECSSAGAIARKFPPKTTALTARNGRGGTWGSISRVFARSRNKTKALSADAATEYSDYPWNSLSEEGYAEKLRLLREASQLPMERWRASQVVAWLEVALGMPQYSTRCAENVKSGKVLLELNDAEMETGLGLAHPMHRKKLRLAVEEQRRPEMVRYPMITQLGHTWVTSEWLPDIGLPQYAESFLHSLVDARMLDTLSKKELEKFLGVTRKFHQASIVHGIHVLRIVKYDRQTLAMRRIQCETVDSDPVVWTNQRFIRWARSIDLGEYADNLKDSGVHGGLVVLEPSFSGETMATALGIPPSKNMIRRHLATEFDALILPARSTLGQGIRSGCGIVPLTGPAGLQHPAPNDRRSASGSLRISPWRGSQNSLTKAFRFNSKSRNVGDRTSSYGNSTSPTPSYSSSSEGGNGGVYATIGLPHYPPPTTAPPPPPVTYGPSIHRVSAPPAGTANETIATDPYQHGYGNHQQHRRVKSISDIGGAGTGSPM